MEASHTNQVQRRGTQCEGAGPTYEKEGQPPGPTHTEEHSASLRQGIPHENQESNSPGGGKAFVTIADRERTQSRPETGDPIV